ncbi:hypothetical protein Angca_006447, partial [Angiostrongylus cantonensis]
LQVNNAEMVQEIHQLLLERESTCHRTCFSLQFNGISLDNFTEIRTINGLVDGSVLHVVEEPYTIREARIHIRHVRDLTRQNDQAEAASAVDMSSLSFLPSINLQERGDRDKPFDGLPPDYVLPGTKERSLTPMLTQIPRVRPALRNMGISSFNPPTGHRKLKGDIMYLFVDILEKRRIHITCCTKGFFVNSSTEEVFNPQPSTQNKAICHSLVDLLNAVSPAFKKAFPALVKRRNERHMLDRLPTPYPVYSWLSPVQEVLEDSIRGEDALLPYRVGFEEHLPGQIRDWNEELQTTHEMPRTSLSERLTRDRSVFKIHGDFINAAVKGAIAVVEGNVVAINPADEPRTHMFIWNNIFFSLGFDVKDHYKELGGDAAALAATSTDLQGVRAYAAIDNSKLCTLGMAVIDYRGYRVTAQSIIPGILDKEQEQSVVYGSVDFGRTVVSSEKYHELLESSAKELKLLPHEVVVDNKGNTAKLFTSYETKGIIGNDGRYYVLDLLRTMPPDVHYLQDAEVSENARTLGFPRSFPHKLATLRQELVEHFHEARCLQFIKIAANHVRQHLASNKDDQDTRQFLTISDIENEVTRALVDVSEGREPVTKYSITKEALSKAAEAVNSLRPETFDIRFNPDCFSTTVKHAPGEDIEKHKILLVEAAEFIVTTQLPEFVSNCLDAVISPIDGESLCDLMHTRGINVRYLGDVVRRVLENGPSSYMVSLTITELVSRCAKHILRQYINSIPQEQLSCAISHLLNAVFGNLAFDHGAGAYTERNTKRNAKKSKKASTTSEWAAFNTREFWIALCHEAKNYYAFDLKADSIESVVDQYGVQKISLLRRLCGMLGIQLLIKDYQLDSNSTRTRLPFTADDIQNLFPVTKHRQPCANDAKKLFNRGQKAMHIGHLREAYEYIAESVNLMSTVYGSMHGELAQALRMLARLAYILGDLAEAVAQQYRATLMSERCNGIDNAYTIIEYVNLAHFAFSNLYIPASLRILYRARYLLLIAYGENHPLMAQIDGNIGVILFAVHEFDAALRFLTSSEAVMAANGEPKRLKSAIIQHIAARAHASRGDFRAALAAEKETYFIYNGLLGPEHEKTKESSEYLSQLTMQAVAFQRKVMDATKGNSVGPLLPTQLPQPSLSSILDVLNVLNGIIIISVGGLPSAIDYTEIVEGKPSPRSLRMIDEALD